MDTKKPGENPWQNARIKPPSARKDGDRPARPPRAFRGPVNVSASGAAEEPPRRPESAQRRGQELRVHGRNACLAVFAHRPDDVRKVYLTEARIGDFKPVLAWCVKHRLGYRVVEAEDLERLTETQHHEGVCFEVRRHPPLAVDAMLQAIDSARPALVAWLDGVGNPHNVGAILRSAANFGIQGMILPAQNSELSGAALRVAEGGAESVRLAYAREGEDVAAVLHAAGFKVAGTVPRDGTPLYKTTFPARLALVLGAEGEGMSKQLIRAADLRITVPGTGAVESLNVSASAAVVFGEFWRQHPPR
ncbi:MAG: TrmH family RNA methyltransferase [Rudaea sp.]